MPDGEKKSRLDIFIEEHFPWGKDGNPELERFPDYEKKREYVRKWLEDHTVPFNITALALVSRVMDVISEQEIIVQKEEGHRFFAKIDNSCMVKTPAGILDKILRGWENKEGKGPELSFNNFHNEMKDLGRFRIVANFLSDVERISSALELPYSSPQADLSGAQKTLQREFQLEHNKMEDNIKLKPDLRKKGERCIKGVFCLKETPAYKVEVQVMTFLQEAWDKKDHYLIYEPRRRGIVPEEMHEIEIFSMSELLYISDLTFDRLRKTILISRMAREVEDASQEG
ncbi:MAG: hypothetical protein AB9903_03715 [Vulcanimicrobiota bacterium]